MIIVSTFNYEAIESFWYYRRFWRIHMDNIYHCAQNKTIKAKNYNMAM